MTLRFVAMVAQIGRRVMRKVVQKFFVLVIVMILAFAVGYTEKERARQFGGTSSIKLPCKPKLFILTWKESNLWYATRPMREGEVPETYTFAEDSSWGVMEGT